MFSLDAQGCGQHQPTGCKLKESRTIGHTTIFQNRLPLAEAYHSLGDQPIRLFVIGQDMN